MYFSFIIWSTSGVNAGPQAGGNGDDQDAQENGHQKALLLNEVDSNIRLSFKSIQVVESLGPMAQW